MDLFWQNLFFTFYHPRPLFVCLPSFQSILQNETVDFCSRIRTRIVIVEAEHADQKAISLLKWRYSSFKWFLNK